MVNHERMRGYGAYRWRFGFFVLACVTTAIFSAWYHRPQPVIDLKELERNHPLIAPELWPQELPGKLLAWEPPHSAEAAEEQLKAALREIEERWPSTSQEGGRQVQIVLRLVTPEGAPRAVVALPGGSLYLVERQGDQWQTELLAEAVQRVAALDLTGDGRPELAASGIHDSGAYLGLQIFTWDDQGVYEVYRNQHGQDGAFGFLEPLPEGRRDL